MGDFWPRLEHWLIELQQDRARFARYLQIAYWISTAFVLLGGVLALLIYAGWWAP